MPERRGGSRKQRAFGLLLAIAPAAGLSAGAAAAEADAKANLELGRQVFTTIAAPPCGLCHTLADAGTSGEIGAKLEELKPDADRVATAVRKGVGIMPPYADKLTEAQIQAVAHYVARAAAAK